MQIKNARISHISLVDRPANKRTFLVTKAEDGSRQWQTDGKIIKADREKHYITGVVYEPNTEDTDGDFMTEDMIRDASHWFLKSGDGVDVQHNFKTLADSRIVESWIAPADLVIEGEAVRKGTWLVTIETEDPAIWAAVQSEKLTGFSMGGFADFEDSTEGLFKRFLKFFQNQKEEHTMTQADVQALIDKAIEKHAKTISPDPAVAATKSATPPPSETVTTDNPPDLAEVVQKAVDTAVAKSLTPPTEPDLETLVTDAVAKAMSPILKSAGLPTNLNAQITKAAETHYLDGVL